MDFLFSTTCASYLFSFHFRIFFSTPHRDYWRKKHTVACLQVRNYCRCRVCCGLLYDWLWWMHLLKLLYYFRWCKRILQYALLSSWTTVGMAWLLWSKNNEIYGGLNLKLIKELLWVDESRHNFMQIRNCSPLCLLQIPNFHFNTHLGSFPPHPIKS